MLFLIEVSLAYLNKILKQPTISGCMYRLHPILLTKNNIGFMAGMQQGSSHKHCPGNPKPDKVNRAEYPLFLYQAVKNIQKHIAATTQLKQNAIRENTAPKISFRHPVNFIHM